MKCWHGREQALFMRRNEKRAEKDLNRSQNKSIFGQSGGGIQRIKD